MLADPLNQFMPETNESLSRDEKVYSIGDQLDPTDYPFQMENAVANQSIGDVVNITPFADAIVGSDASSKTSSGTPTADALIGKQHFDYTVSIIDSAGNTNASAIDAFTTVAELAMQTWATHLGGAKGATLDLVLNIGGTSAVASASPGAMYYGDRIDANGSGSFDNGDFVSIVPGTVMELQTGDDPNGAAADIIVSISDKLINNGGFFVDPTLSQDVPGSKIDLYSVLVHEIGHGLGFLGYSSKDGNRISVDFTGDKGETVKAEIGTMYDYNISENDAGRLVYSGENVVEAYGDVVHLEDRTGSTGSDVSHFAGKNGGGRITDTRFSLMNPYVVSGDRVEVGNLELAVLEDIGHTIVKGASSLVNDIDSLTKADTPIFEVNKNFSVNGTTLSFKIELPEGTPFSKVSSSVGYEIIGINGTSVTGRALVKPGQTSYTVTADLEDLFGKGASSFDGSFDVRLFNPINSRLPNDGNSALATVGTPSDNPPPPPADDPTPPAGDSAPPADKPTLPVDDPTPPADDKVADKKSGSGDDVVAEGPGDKFVGTTGADDLVGGEGDDTIIGRFGHDTLSGNDGNDELIGGKGNDTLIGGAGDDILVGDESASKNVQDRNLFVVGEGHDTIVAFQTADGSKVYFDGLQIDYKFDKGANWAKAALNELTAKPISTEEDFVRLVELVTKDGASETSASIEGNALVINFDQNNSVRIENISTESTLFQSINAVIDPKTSTPPDDQGKQDSPDVPDAEEGIEFTGGRGDELIEGSSGSDKLNGHHGDDTILGGAGDDTLIGGPGEDRLVGGAGDDLLIGDWGDFGQYKEQDTFVVGQGHDQIDAFKVVWNDGRSLSNLEIDYTFTEGSASANAELNDMAAAGFFTDDDFERFVELLMNDGSSSTSASVVGDSLTLIFGNDASVTLNYVHYKGGIQNLLSDEISSGNNLVQEDLAMLDDFNVMDEAADAFIADNVLGNDTGAPRGVGGAFDGIDDMAGIL
ncbi:MAG: hypothetical protein AAF788_01120 [Pseudomonadota bacterium]